MSTQKRNEQTKEMKNAPPPSLKRWHAAPGPPPAPPFAPRAAARSGKLPEHASTASVPDAIDGVSALVGAKYGRSAQIGARSSTTFTVRSHVAVLPARSVAEYVTSYVPATGTVSPSTTPPLCVVLVDIVPSHWSTTSAAARLRYLSVCTASSYSQVCRKPSRARSPERSGVTIEKI